ncbi:MAG TPA: sensor histidine kinase [Candidatus Polarisedimenticolia bacterium]|nr:sensor histidine kinase [Candidatus Polarisedimenticolia bacterium]
MTMDAHTDAPAARPGTGPRDARFDALLAESQAAVTAAANTLRSVRTKFREAYLEELNRWESLRDEVDERSSDRLKADGVAADSADTRGEANGTLPSRDDGTGDARANAMRRELSVLGIEVGRQRAELGRIDVTLKSLENAWLFLERGDVSLEGDSTGGADVQMRIVQAQEAERSRLAQEVHDGPAQALSNAIFQVEYIERVVEEDSRLAKTELRFLRELLRRELGDVRSFISQLRPPLLVELGLDGAIREAADRMSDLVGIPVTLDLSASAEHLSDAAQTVVLRVVQEALQNVRKHAEASHVAVRSHVEGTDYVLEIRDDGRGFDVPTVALRGRRNFGLQFMRERGELIGARFEVRSRPDGGTVVRLAIPAAHGSEASDAGATRENT